MPLTLSNTGFTSDTVSANPAGWTTTEQAAGNIGVQPPTITANGKVLTFQGRNTVNHIQQSFLTSEITADSHGRFTIQFEAGWRSNRSQRKYSTSLLAE